MMNSQQNQHDGAVKKIRLILVVMFLVAVIGGLAFYLYRMEPDTAPDVKVAVAGYPGSINADFKISNFSRRPIKVYPAARIERSIMGHSPVRIYYYRWAQAT